VHQLINAEAFIEEWDNITKRQIEGGEERQNGWQMTSQGRWSVVCGRWGIPFPG
jgi:hypothetical protein